MYESFCKYQNGLLGQFDRLAEEYAFEVIDGSQSIQSVFGYLRAGIREILENKASKPVTLAPKDGRRLAEEPATVPVQKV
jgi:hypothetical protein